MGANGDGGYAGKEFLQTEADNGNKVGGVVYSVGDGWLGHGAGARDGGYT
jgi:hypothetical protein